MESIAALLMEKLLVIVGAVVAVAVAAGKWTALVPLNWGFRLQPIIRKLSTIWQHWSAGKSIICLKIGKCLYI